MNFKHIVMQVLALMAISIMGLSPAKSYGQNVRTYIPERAKLYLENVYLESSRLLPEYTMPYYFGSLIEHESCLSLTHSRCWSPTSELKNSVELGIGFGQITKAWNSAGAIRFDSLEAIRSKYMSELRELNWDNIKQRPDLQIRAIILLWNDSYKGFYPVTNIYQRTAMADSAYNGGKSDVDKARRACGLAKSCDPQIWFDHVERHNPKSNTPRPQYGNRSNREINNNHVRDVMLVRLNKYQQHWENWDLDKELERRAIERERLLKEQEEAERLAEEARLALMLQEARENELKRSEPTPIKLCFLFWCWTVNKPSKPTSTEIEP